MSSNSKEITTPYRTNQNSIGAYKFDTTAIISEEAIEPDLTTKRFLDQIG